MLKRLGYPGYSFETHTPTYLTKKRVFDAYCDLKDHVAENGRHYPVTPSIILNHAFKHEKMPLQDLRAAGLRCGFRVKQPTYEQVAKGCEGKTFFNFDDKAFGEAIRRFLENRFPEPSKYEVPPSSSKELPYTAGTSQIIVP